MEISLSMPLTDKTMGWTKKFLFTEVFTFCAVEQAATQARTEERYIFKKKITLFHIY